MFSYFRSGSLVEDWRKNVNNHRTNQTQFCGLNAIRLLQWVKSVVAHSFYTTIHEAFTHTKSLQITDTARHFIHLSTRPTITTIFSCFYKINNISKD